MIPDDAVSSTVLDGQAVHTHNTTHHHRDTILLTAAQLPYVDCAVH